MVRVEVSGPTGSRVLRMALDTGATYTVINEALLVQIGYDPGQAPNRMRIATASGVAVVSVLKLSALGVDRLGFGVLCHTLPSAVTIDGLLGLDFFRGRILTLDFQAGQITLT